MIASPTSSSVAPETDTLALQQALRQAYRDLAARDRFLAILSHELRSPMSGIQSWSYVLESTIDGDASKPVLQALAGIKTGIQQQVALIEGLLDATQVMAGQISLDLQPLDVAAVLDSARAAMLEVASAKHISIDVEVAPPAQQIIADEKRILQVLRNLLNNAIRFSGPNTVVRLHSVAIGSEIGLCVLDHGRGIAAERLARMQRDIAVAEGKFEITSEQRVEPPSIGLKLTLSQRLIALQHGRFEVASDGVDQGVEATVFLPGV